MDHIVDTTREMVERIRNGNIPDEAFATLKTPCPKCGATVQENYRKFQCQSCDFAIWRVMSGRELAPEEVEELIEKRAVGPLTGFRSRMGRPFAGALKLSAEMKAEFDFGHGEDRRNGEAEAPDFSAQEPLGACPKCGARVFQQPVAYVCEKSVGAERSCDFRSGRVILQRSIEREQMLKLLSTGKTDLLHRFISKKGRPFSAFLVRGTDGKVGFEFAPRAAKRVSATPSRSAVRSSEKTAGRAPKTSTATVSKVRAGARAAKTPAGTMRRKSTI